MVYLYPCTITIITRLGLYQAKNYTKMEQYIPMRDGKRLFTSIYLPKDQSKKVSNFNPPHARAFVVFDEFEGC